MKNKLFIITLLILIFPLFNCWNNKKEINKEVSTDKVEDEMLQKEMKSLSQMIEGELEEYFKHEDDSYFILHYEKGNFTNSGKMEYVVFYGTDRNKNGGGFFGIKIFSDYEEFEFPLYAYSSGDYEKRHTDIFVKDSLDLGKWNGYCYINDFNNNGLDEVFIFSITGMGMGPEIYEYKNNKIERVLSGRRLSKIETLVENNKKILKLYDEGYDPEIPEGYRGWYKYTWNEEKEIYEEIEKGTEKWYEPVTYDENSPMY